MLDLQNNMPRAPARSRAGASGVEPRASPEAKLLSGPPPQRGGDVGAFGSLLLEASGGVDVAPPVPCRQFEPCPAAEPILSGAQFTGSSPVGASDPPASARCMLLLEPPAL